MAPWGYNFIDNMWNKIACNKIVQRKSLQKQRTRLLSTLRNTRSVLRSTNQPKTVHRSSSNHKPIAPHSNCTNNKKTVEKYELINKENRKIATRIEEIQKSRVGHSISMDKMRATTSLLQTLENNKRVINGVKQRELDSENKKMLEKIVNATSTLRNLRVKTLANSVNDWNKPRTILIISNPTSQKSQQSKLQDKDKGKDNNRCRKVKTEARETMSKSIENEQQTDLAKNYSKVSKVSKVKQEIQEEYAFEEDIMEEVIDNNN